MIFKRLIVCCFLFFSERIANANVLLQAPPLITNQEIDAMAKQWETQFNWRFSWRKIVDLGFTCVYKNERAGFKLEGFGHTFYAYNTAEENSENVQQQVPPYPYYFAEPRSYANAQPHRINLQDLLTMLASKRFFFYTGAGISAAGSVGTMPQLEKSLMMHNGKVCFFAHLLTNPESIVQAFNAFCRTAIYNEPTLAHRALHELTQQNRIAIITDNVDLLQERAGGRPLFTHSSALYELQKSDFEQLDACVCVGFSRDDCGFIAHYKNNNSRGIVIALDIKQPSYLSNEDYLLQSDIQKVLPEWLEQSKNDPCK